MFTITLMGFLIFLLSLTFVFITSYYLTNRLIGQGSDHPFHLGLIRTIRKNHHSLFVKMPHFINETYCEAFPLFMHKSLSYLSDKQVLWAEKLLNPICNCLFIVTLYAVSKLNGFPIPLIGWFCLFCAFTPQFFQIGCARNYGFSSRPIGILLFSVLGVLVFFISLLNNAPLLFVIAVIIGYLIWGISTFTQQSMVIFSILMILFFHNWILLTVVCTSLLLFIALHSQYSLNYLKHTLLFIKAYAINYAGIYILKSRYSVWRDLVYDIWIKLAKSLKEGVSYAYYNPFIIILFLNPLVFIASFSAWIHQPTDPFILFCSQIAFVGFFTFFLTSFRCTRFLGEPERYVEIVTIFSTISGIWFIYNWINDIVLAIILAYFILATIIQLIIQNNSSNKVDSMGKDMDRIEQIIKENFSNEEVRFCSNNSQFIKFMMPNPWQFAFALSPEEKFGNTLCKEAFSVFPYYRKDVFGSAIIKYKINCCLIDKSVEYNYFEDDEQMRYRITMIFNTDKYILLKIKW